MKPKKNSGQKPTPKELIKNLEKTTKISDKEKGKKVEHPVHQSPDDCHGIQESEFKPSSYFKVTKRSLTYKVSLAGIFLALSVAVSAIDILLESVQIPIGQVYISLRFLDTIVLLLGLPVLGPLFASLIGMMEPIFHNLIHGMEHGWIQPLTDAIANPIIIFVTWMIFYLAFRNSPYHKDPNKKKDWFKRLTPSAILVVVVALISTFSFIFALYIQDLATGTNWVPPVNGDEHHSADWSSLTSGFAKMFFAILGINLLKYLIAFSCFVVFEGKMRPINHRYR